MDDIKLRARAKINITLDAIRKMENGYHELEMIMQTVNLCDNARIIAYKYLVHNILLKT